MAQRRPAVRRILSVGAENFSGEKMECHCGMVDNNGELDMAQTAKCTLLVTPLTKQQLHWRHND